MDKIIITKTFKLLQYYCFFVVKNLSFPFFFFFACVKKVANLLELNDLLITT